MNDQEIINLFNENKKIKYTKEIKDYLLNRYKDSSCFAESTYRIINKIEYHPTCPKCGNEIFWTKGHGFKKYCCRSCWAKDNSPFKKKEIQQKIKNKFIEKYGTDNVLKLKEFHDKAKQTKLEKYGDENYNNKEKIRQTFLRKYGFTCAAKVSEIRKKQIETAIKKYGGVFHKEKVSETIQEKYGVKWFTLSNKLKERANSKEAIEKGIETRRKNHTFNVSKPEENLYKILIDKYGEDNIIRQYKSFKYPWRCDFYVKSKDLYIELQGYYTHGTHPYDENNPKDVKILEELKLKYQDYYLQNRKYPQIITIWTEYDVKKREVAKKNKLNFIEEFDSINFSNLKRLNII